MRSVMKPILHLHCAQEWICPVRPPKSIAGVDHVPLVGDIRAAEAYGPALTERLSQREIERVIPGQMARSIAIQETRAVIDGDSGKAAPRQVSLKACRQGIALVVVEIE